MAGSDNRDRRDTGTEETWAAVLADALALCKGFKDAGFDGDAHDIRVLVERFEAAHKRELESVTKRNGLGNVAKMLEALELAKKAICHSARYVCQSLSSETGNIQANCADVLCPHRELCKAKTAINAALSAPARNCDVYDLTAIHEQWSEFCKRYAQEGMAPCDDCPLGAHNCQFAFAMMPAERGEP